MSDSKPTLGQAIDQIVGALQTFDTRERQTVLHTVCVHLQIDLGNFVQVERQLEPELHRLETVTPDAASAARHPDGRGGLDIRSLREEKKPNSARQMTCLVAYYLQMHAPENERRETVGTAELERYFIQANYKLPKALEQLLIDCKGAGYFESAGRGEYRLTRVGFNLVTHGMPTKKQA